MSERQLTTWIPESIHQKLKIKSVKENKTIKEIVNEIFEDYFNNLEK